ncbi:MAG TPA: FAD-dependent oxidoreductase, partial [Acidimicrobiales bacterium]|nr:FAD-dependent oxidoreductase [Acidimicrobiales bacterium]
QRVLGDRLGGLIRDLHRDHGVELRPRATVAELRGTKTVDAVVLEDGRVEPADVVVAGIGALPRAGLAEEAAGLRVQDGIVVDQCLGTSVHGVFAAGDVANAWDPVGHRHRRVEHWANALNQGFAAGRNAAGAREPYARLPYFYSDQYDLGMEYVGHHGPDDALVVRGDLGARELIAFWHRDGLVTAAANVNVWDVVDDLKALIEARTPVDPARLADPEVPLPDLVPA